MLLTRTQKHILQLLKIYRCLRDDQIIKLVGMETKNDDMHTARQLARLRKLFTYKIYRPWPEHTAMACANPDADLLTAIDVMLEFQDHGLEMYRPGRPPYKLIFFKTTEDKGLRAYYVAVVHKGEEHTLSFQAQVSYKGSINAVIFVLEDMSQADAVLFPFEHFFAVKADNGFRFFKGVVSIEH